MVERALLDGCEYAIIRGDGGCQQCMSGLKVDWLPGHWLMIKPSLGQDSGVECLGKVVGEVVEAVDKSLIDADLATVSFAANKERGSTKRTK
jgi:hypothetical protein